MQSLFQLAKRLLQNASWSGYIEAHETFAGTAELSTIIQSQVRLVDKEIQQLRMGEPQSSAIQINQETGLWTDRHDGG